MSGDAAHLEAIGESAVVFEFRGHTITIPRALENWPLDAIRGAAAEAVPGRALRFALDILLAGQTAGPLTCVDDYVELSHRMADAVGVSPLPETPVQPADVFGGVPTLLDLLDNNEDDVASDLRRFWGVVYADRWRGSLTLREIWTFIRRLPVDGVTARARNGGKEVWQLGHYIAAAVWEQRSGRMYPGRPHTAAEIAAWKEAMRIAAEKAANLRASAARYAPTATPAQTAAATARENRIRELERNGQGQHRN